MGFPPTTNYFDIPEGSNIAFSCSSVGLNYNGNAPCPSVISAIQQDLIDNGISGVNAQLQPPNQVVLYANNPAPLQQVERILSGRGIQPLNRNL